MNTAPGSTMEEMTMMMNPSNPQPQPQFNPFNQSDHRQKQGGFAMPMAPNQQVHRPQKPQGTAMVEAQMLDQGNDNYL